VRTIHILPVLFALAVASAPAQERRDSSGATYKVEFRVRDGSDAAAKNGRRYTIWIDGGSRGSFHIGERVPVASGSFQPGTGGAGINPLVNTQYTYFDTGVNIDAGINDSNGRLNLTATIDVSTIVPHKAEPGVATIPNPTVAQVKIAINAMVGLNKPAQVASIDDPVTQRKFDVEAVVTKVE